MNRIKNWFSLLPIRTRITLVTSTIIIIAILAGSALLIKNVYQALEEEQGNRVLAIGRTIAQLETIKDNIGKPNGWKKIQPIAERVRLATNVDYVVIFDMKRIRYSHPIEAKIGTVFQGGDEGPALGQQEYMSLAKGIGGIAIRSFVPIMDREGEKQIGVVIVGTILPTVYQLIFEHKWDLILSITLGVVVGLFGAWLLTNSIKRQIFNLEPVEIARLLEERESIINTIDEGIIAIDQNKKIKVMNDRAAQIIGTNQNVIGHTIEEVIPNTKLPMVMESKKPQLRQMMVLNKTIVMVNRLPIVVKNKTVGAVATFQDRTEVVSLAEELTGIRKFSDVLRAQNHEFMNKFHTIAGLIQLKRYDDALNLIMNYTEEKEELSRFLMERIKDTSISGLILGKISHAKELGVDLIVDRQSYLSHLPSFLSTHDIILIIGNLLENAIDATIEKKEQPKLVQLRLETTPTQLIISVKDNGIGIPEELKEKIFEMGYTTKKGKGQGIGLTLVLQHVKAYQGDIEVITNIEKGTNVIVSIPLKEN
ncbi:ATP-binding protein [Tepidibacillus fermentans]|uniref:histidine kinase n=1 Tax=Tepidibacillus fermentans TaxID=1281767 RepID=A0A4R3KBP1_9BACI|nr:sensor histidine kinase [Tepidibacillus fermentans]TCS80596.1 two-component system sensor histidine kinase DctS [Tepidibacillus fermentans]